MPLTSDLKPFFVKDMPGLNTKVEDLETEDESSGQLKWATVCQNSRFDQEPGTCAKRPPISYYNTSLGSGPMLGSVRFYRSDGTIKTVCAYNNTIYVGTDSTGAMTAIRTLGTAGKRCSFVTYQNILMGFDGYNAVWCYDGSNDVTWELGSCKAVLGVSTGITATAISYQITMDSGAYICGAVSNVIATASNQNILLSNIPLGPIGTTDRKIYRKDSGSSGTYKLVATISDNVTTTYTDSTSSASLGAAIGATTDPIPKGAYPRIHRERLFFSGDPSNLNRIYYSEVYLPGYIQVNTNTMYMEISPEDGDEIVGIPLILGRMACFKKNNIRIVNINSPTSGADPSTWYAEDPLVWNGSPAPYSIVETSMGIMFLGWNHWQRFDGSSVTPIIDEFNTDNIFPSNYNNVFAYWLHTNILLAVYTSTDGARQFNDRVMRMDWLRNKLSLDVLNVNCISTQTGDDEGGEIFYGMSDVGRLAKAEESDVYYRLFSQSSANIGTVYNAFIGGTESTPYIQIGAITGASSIPSDICIFWDDTTTTPGSGWTEVTGLDGNLIKITSNAVDTTGTVGHTATGTSATVSYVGYRMFKKNGTTTEYTFPVGAIVMWDQSFDPLGWQEVAENQYVAISSTCTGGTLSFNVDTTLTAGTAIGNIVQFRFMKCIGQQSTWDGLSQYVYCIYHSASAPGNGWTDVTATYAGYYICSSASGPVTVNAGTGVDIDFIQLGSTTHSYTGGADATSIDGDFNTGTYVHVGGNNTSIDITSEHDFANPTVINSVQYRMWNHGVSTANYDHHLSLYMAIDYTTDGSTWNHYASTYNAYNVNNNHDPANDHSYDTGHLTATSTVTGVTGIRAHVWGDNGGNNSPSGELNAEIYEIQAFGNYSFVTFRLAKKILGQMRDYNTALVTPSARGVYASPGLQIAAKTLGRIYWNEVLAGTDDIVVYFRTGTTQASVENFTAVTSLDYTTDFITVTSHGWSNGQRIQISGAVLPTGLTNCCIYYIVNKTTHTFQVAYTAGGAPIDFSSNGTSVTYKTWDSGYSSSGLDMQVTPNIWIQYALEFIATDTTVANPTAYLTDGFILKFNYSQSFAAKETSVEWIYEFGYRHFNTPMMDKIFKKIQAAFAGKQGSLQITWTTEDGNTGTFTIDLSVNSYRWESFFPDNAYGRYLKLSFYKNDLFDFKLKEISGIFTPEPIIV